MAMHHGCYFHFCQSLFKQVQSLGLATAYLDDEDTRLACRSTMALALLPIEHVEEAVELLKDDSPTEMTEFFKYFQYQRLKRMPPKYWNVATLEFRTNNFCEGELSSFFGKYVSIFCHIGWHNKFNNRVDKHHPNMWHLFECLKREELSFRQQLGKINSGMQKKSNNTTCITQTQVDTLTQRHGQKEIGLMEFIHGLSTLVAKNSKTVI
jgi:hypothetical protein